MAQPLFFTSNCLHALNNRTIMTRSSCLKHLILELIFFLSTSTWVSKCCSAFIPRYSIIRPHYRAIFLQHSVGAAADNETNNNDKNRPLAERQETSTAPTNEKKSRLQQKLTEHFQRLNSVDAGNRAPPLSNDHCEKYLVKEKFMEEDFYWQDYVRPAHFKTTFENGCLYRPKIVEDLYEEVKDAINRRLPRGIMVKGPPGVGKSHTLVNLVRKLLYGSDGKFLVTFIPDCSFFSNERHLLDAICSSFGAALEEMETHYYDEQYDLENFIAVIDSILNEMDKQWIFVYGQINRIFVRPEFQKTKDLGTICFPYNLIGDAMKRRRITSVISASAINEIFYKERHPGFGEYHHPLSMEWNELQMLYPSLADKNQDSIMEVTGGVPLQVSSLIDFNFDVDQYENEESESILYSLQTLEMNAPSLPRRYADIKESAIACVLEIAGDVTDYDWKYTSPRLVGYEKHYDPVYPLVLTVFREYFWDEIMALITEREETLLRICKDSQTTNDTRGRLFVAIVINRCIGRNLTLLPTELDGTIDATLTESDFPGLSQCELVELFRTNNLPSFKTMVTNGIYVPRNPYFPAIDFIWKMGSITWFAKVHVDCDTPNVLPKLKEMCKRAEWQGKIYFLYLSPEKTITELLPQSFLSHEHERDIVVKALSIKSFSCLSTIVWREGCSLDRISKAA